MPQRPQDNYNEAVKKMEQLIKQLKRDKAPIMRLLKASLPTAARGGLLAASSQADDELLELEDVAELLKVRPDGMTPQAAQAWGNSNEAMYAGAFSSRSARATPQMAQAWDNINQVMQATGFELPPNVFGEDGDCPEEGCNWLA